MASFLGPLSRLMTPVKRILLPSKLGFTHLKTQQSLQTLSWHSPVIQSKSSLLASLQSSCVCQANILYNYYQFCRGITLLELHQRGPKVKKRTKKRPLDGKPQMKGVVVRTLIKKPKKPNSANRKCVLVRLSNGKEKVAYVPGEGHNLQEHSTVLVRVGRLQDVPGVKLKVIRGKYDCAHVVKIAKT